MKKLNLSIIVLLLVLASSCTKEIVKENTPTKIGDYFEHKLNAKELIQNEEDPTDVIFNRGLVSLSEAMLEVLKNKNIRTFILENAKQNGEGFVTFEELFVAYPTMKEELNAFLNKSTLAKELEITDYDSYVSTMVHTNIDYMPVINVPNIENAIETGNYFVSPGIEVEENDNLGISDEIFSWQNNDGFISEISIGEEKAMQEKNPLFVVTPHVIDNENYQAELKKAINSSQSNKQNENTQLVKSTDKTNLIAKFRLWQYRIAYKYERTGKSDYSLAAVQNRNGQYKPKVLVGQTGVSTNKITGLSYPNVTYNHNTNTSIAELWADSQYSNDILTLATYERDWYASYKTLMPIHGLPGYLSGRRRYAHEYYLFGAFLQLNTYGPQIIQYNSKGFLRISRTY